MKIENKNIFKKSDYYDMYSNYDYTNEAYRCKYIPLSPNTTYTVSFTASATGSVILLMNRTSNVNGAGYLDFRKSSDTKTYTTDSTGNLYIGSLYANSDEAIVTRLNECNIQIEKNSTTTTYIEHQEQSLPLTLGSLEYCEIGDYEDEFMKPSGKNLFDVDEFISEANAIGSGYAELTTYLNTNVLRYRNSIPSLQFMKGKFKENTRYTFKTAVARSNWVSEGSNAPFLNITYTDGTNDSLNCSSTENSFTVSTFTSQANKTIDYIKVSDYSGSQKINLNLSVTQLEEGTSATEYEPYGVGVWYLKKNIGKDILNGSETWNLQNVTSGKNYYTKINSALADSGVPSYSNISKYRYFGTIEQNVPQYSSYISNGKNFNILADIFNDTSALQTFLNNTNMILYYVLATPTYTPLDLPSIPTFEGTTIITFGTEVQPSNAWVKYYAEEE